LAVNVGLDQGQLSKMERGIVTITIENLNNIAAELNVPVSYIMRVLDSEDINPDSIYETLPPRSRRILKLMEEDLPKVDSDRLLEEGDMRAELSRLKKGQRYA